MNDTVLYIKDMGKAYRIAHASGRSNYKTLQEDLVRLVKRPFSRRNAASTMETFWALKDLSFEVKQGEVLGIIGRNGAGKSTLLKILSRITKPTEGFARVTGRIGSLLEVGTGFHPELTGRENVYLNGAVLGMSRRDITAHFDEIVTFAEVEQFLDTPVKRYSSGMYMRLAFAVAAHLKPEILIIDEVLAVGDAAFQKKSMGKMSDAAQSGRTVVFVSHNMSAIESLCSRVLWLDGGRLRAEGDSGDTVRQYMDAVERGDLVSRGRSPVQVDRAWLQDEHGQPTAAFAPGSSIDVRIAYSTQERFEQPYFSLTVESHLGSVCCANMVFDGQRPGALEGSGVIGCVFHNLPLMPQSYTIRLVIYSSDAEQYLFESQEIARFNVVGALSDYGMVGERADHFAQYAVPLVMPYEWLFPDGQRVPVELVKKDKTPS